MNESRLTRRAFLGTTALGVGSLAAACSSNSDAKTSNSTPTPGGGSTSATGTSTTESPSAGGTASAASNAGPHGLTFPAFVPYTGVKPTLPALPNGTASYFRAALPIADQPKFWSGPPPGHGGQMSVLTFMNNAPTAENKNQWWQAINKAVGTDVKIGGAPGGDYPSKFATTIASGDLPDVVVLDPARTPGLPPLLKAKFADLTEYLSGDAVKEFPAFANQPGEAWKACDFNGSLYAVPHDKLPQLTGQFVCADLIAGDASPTPKSGNELLALFKGLSDLKRNRWALLNVWSLLTQINEMVGTPNVWAVDDGKFTRDYETAQYKQALGVVRQCWSSHYIHPNAFQPDYVNYTNTLGLAVAGTCGYLAYGPSFGTMMSGIKVRNEKRDPVWIPATTWDGGAEPKHYLGTASSYMAAIPKTKPDRVKELLSIMSWFASPWGTQENTLLVSGLPKIDFTLKPNGVIDKRTDLGTAEVPGGMQYIASAPAVHYNPNQLDYIKTQYEAQKQAMDNAAPLITQGLDSPTDATKGATLDKNMQNAAADVIQGRKDLSDWDSAVKTWKSSGGDTIRSEYEKAYAAAAH